MFTYFLTERVYSCTVARSYRSFSATKNELSFSFSNISDILYEWFLAFLKILTNIEINSRQKSLVFLGLNSYRKTENLL